MSKDIREEVLKETWAHRDEIMHDIVEMEECSMAEAKESFFHIYMQMLMVDRQPSLR